MALLFRSKRVLPITAVIRAVCSQSCVQSQIFSTVTPPPPPPLTCCFPQTNLHFFSSTASTRNQLQVLEDEISCTEKSIQVIKIPDGFPFEIEDYPGLKTVSLKREYPDEIVKVKAQNAYTLEDGINYTITLDICIAKPNGRCFEFKCMAFSGAITVKSFIVRNGEHALKGAYYGDGMLDFIVPRYLMVRGIDEYDFPEFICEYMLNKSRRENLTWLKNVKNFMEGNNLTN